VYNRLQSVFTITPEKLRPTTTRFVNELRVGMVRLIAAITKRSLETCHVAVGGPVFTKYPQFHDQAMEVLEDVFEWPRDDQPHPVKLVPAVDGSSVGAAVICALSSDS
jgi:hexokinase